MSGILSAILPGLPTGTWRDGLRPASFRGVPFEVDTHDREGGRRVAEHEFPLSNQGAAEDLGRSIRRFGFDAFVIGDDYMETRDALLAACEDTAGPGALIHPTLGEFQVICSRISVRETKADGGMAVFTLTFVEWSGTAGLLQKKSTLSNLLATVKRVIKIARFAFAVHRVAKSSLGGFLMRAGLGMLSDAASVLAGRFLGMPGLNVLSIGRAIADLGRDDDAVDASTYAARVTGTVEAVAEAAPVEAAIPEAGEAFSSRADGTRDPRMDAGVALLALWAEPEILPLPVDEAREHEALRLGTEALIRQTALAAAVQTYALADWPHADAAVPIRDALIEALDTAAEHAANAGDDELFRAWRALSVAVVEDFRERIQQAPRMVPYDAGRSLPALAAAHRLYRDASRADELAGVTGAPHPAFLPAAGLRLSP
ncbi:DNA circularization protein [Roseomonas xinghualingensis]|uniref:DNA circularization protein n=1 Tax=Roseomonas xinghualingensis TaxID=2986475 RepID=UPI0021F116D2|nr:DNA circularization N-terminal domain-containing protein [Roseomonas sp. SXEYE001]MCV4209381.1 DNA circularization N-terminal domain-containing protein [Roseomonas sp. SXEYE001]